MEDETRLINQPGSTPSDDVTVRSGANPATSPAGDAAANPETTRVMIEQTRARMSETIDEIEDVLIRKKERLQDRLDVLAPIRERPLPSLGIALGAGLVLGLLTGGGDDEDGDDEDAAEDLEEQAEKWERRARRLLRIARQQQAELAALSRVQGHAASASLPDEKVDDPEPAESSGLSRLGDEIADRVSDFLVGAVRALFGGPAVR